MARDGRKRHDVKVGQLVTIVLKQDQRTGALTEGTVKRILTKKNFHPHGIKVMLQSGKVGRVKEILEEVDNPWDIIGRSVTRLDEDDALDDF